MQRSLFSLAVSSVTLMPLAAYADSSTWTVDPHHSSAHFSVRHMMVSNVGGDFGNVSGEVRYDGTHLAQAKVEATIDASSVDTRQPKRDAHLKSPDFLDTAKYPTITFKSTRVVPGQDAFDIIGDLTLHGVTKPVVLHAEPLSPAVKDGHGNVHIGTTATAKINRRDYGVNFNGLLDNGGALVGDDVKVTIDIDLMQKQEASNNESKKKSG